MRALNRRSLQVLAWLPMILTASTAASEASEFLRKSGVELASAIREGDQVLVPPSTLKPVFLIHGFNKISRLKAVDLPEVERGFWERPYKAHSLVGAELSLGTFGADNGENFLVAGGKNAANILAWAGKGTLLRSRPEGCMKAPAGMLVTSLEAYEEDRIPGQADGERSLIFYYARSEATISARSKVPDGERFQTVVNRVVIGIVDAANRCHKLIVVDSDGDGMTLSRDGIPAGKIGGVLTVKGTPRERWLVLNSSGHETWGYTLIEIPANLTESATSRRFFISIDSL